MAVREGVAEALGTPTVTLTPLLQGGRTWKAVALETQGVGVSGGSPARDHSASAEGVRMSFMSPSRTLGLGDHSV